MNYLPAKRAFLTIVVSIFISTVTARANAAETSATKEQSPSDVQMSLKPFMDLEAGWASPPRIARTRCYWWWLNGNVTTRAIQRDLQEMKKQGYGGALIFDAGGAELRGNKQVPHGPVFGSPEWRKRLLDAVSEADRLGLELGLNITSGWNLGGPGVTPDEASKQLGWSEKDIEGGKPVTVSIPQSRSRDNYYRDIAVIALRLPTSQKYKPGATGPLARIKHFEQKAYYGYPGSVTAPAAWHLLETAPSTADEVVFHSDDVVDLTKNFKPDGTLQWDAPAGQWRILRFGYTLKGSHVSTHSEGWGGLAIDYMDRGAFESYWRRNVEPILAEAKPYLGGSLRFLTTDSWELGPVNWTPEMPQQFQRLRGYDLAPYLPALAGYIVENREVSTRFLNDFRRTIADLIAENKYLTFSEQAKKYGLGIAPESGGPHPAPIDALENLGISDFPMGEFWARSHMHRVEDFKRFFVKQTSSASHVYGRRTVLSEAFTTIGNHWQDPRRLRPAFDRACCEGHNLAYWHTFDCSPAEMGTPGQCYFAGTHLNPGVTWWDQSHAFVDYMNRCHFLLQQGVPVSDVLHYYGENIPAFVRLKRDDPAKVLPGYDYDVIDTKALLQRIGVDAQGNVVLPEGTSYRALSITPHDAISLPTLKHIARLVEQGATLIGPKPKRQYSLTDYPKSDAEFERLTTALWGDDTPQPLKGHPYGKGKVFATDAARPVLQAQGIGPDFTWTGGDAETFLDYIHRRTDAADLYYVVNRKDRPETIDASFRIAGFQPELWCPLTGTIRDAEAFTQKDGRTIVPLRLDGEQSLFVVFRKPIPADAQGKAKQNFPVYKPIQTISGPWTVRFNPMRGKPLTVEFKELTDWTKRPEEDIRYYSGKAVYEKTFDVAKALPADKRIVLDLGELKNLAEVSLNGHDLGIVWMDPFRVDVTDAIRPGTNRLTIKVTNLWQNRLIGDAALPDDQKHAKTNLTGFKADTPLVPSGLFGPVTLQIESK